MKEKTKKMRQENDKNHKMKETIAQLIKTGILEFITNYHRTVYVQLGTN